MQKKVVFFFAGTGDDGADNWLKKEKFEYNDDVIRIYVKGCQAKGVGQKYSTDLGGMINPDLDIVAQNIRTAFDLDPQNKGSAMLNFDKLKKNFPAGLLTSSGIYAIESNKIMEKEVSVDTVVLEGFSRGAVTTYAVAKKLNDLDIKMHIIANQPVPGESSSEFETFNKYHDLTNCQNLHSATNILAAYSLGNGWYENTFFKQMLVKFPNNIVTVVENILVPHQQHLDWFYSSPIPFHINRALLKHEILKKNNFQREELEKLLIKEWYRTNDYFFPPEELSQEIYGKEALSNHPLTQDPLYLEFVQDSAKRLVAPVKGKSLSTEEAEAILSLNQSDQEDLIDFINNKNKRSKCFVAVVNKVNGFGQYLTHMSQNELYCLEKQIADKDEFKTEMLAAEKEFKTSIFRACHDYLSHEEPGEDEKNILEKTIISSGSRFKERISTNLSQAEKQINAKAAPFCNRIAVACINFLTHLSIIGLCLNYLHMRNTGYWFLFHSKEHAKEYELNYTAAKAVAVHKSCKLQASVVDDFRKQILQISEDFYEENSKPIESDSDTASESDNFVKHCK